MNVIIPNTMPRPEFNIDDALKGADTGRAELTVMRDAGTEVLNCQRVLRKTSSNIVGEILRNQGTFFEWNHYPKGDAIDRETHSQYYYHAHPKSDRPGEHGHFHNFLAL